MQLWYTEEHTKNVRLSLKVTEHIYHHQSEFQMVDVIDTVEYGRMLLLDGLVMVSERDEAAYHEMLVHVPAFTHNRPKNALVIGGGDGGSVRELLKHTTIESVDLVEIDREVLEVSREYLPGIAAGLDDGRVSIHFEDGIKFVQGISDSYDLVMVDSIDPVGPAVGLFEKPFYQDAHRCLRKDGILCAQAESPFYEKHIALRMKEKLKTLFPIVLPYLAYIPTYPSGMWAFIIASKARHPIEAFREQDAKTLEGIFKYYTSEIHRASFALPAEIAKHLGNTFSGSGQDS